ncbi:MAG: patatin-like phospholipase family protein [Lachnospiraceae bacterium]|nr:patatin-like phospholipase family protein [Lachnospiraceae bacterium]
MIRKIRNLVFEGGGILGISYLGVLDYMFHNGWMKDMIRVAGTSAGAITACITSFNLPFSDIKQIVNTLDYKKVPSKSELDNVKFISDDIKDGIEKLFGDINCIYRLINNYGWYSTEYFYNWIKEVIDDQFDFTKKLPPYTFEDFKKPYLHKNNRQFLDLYIVGTNMSMKASEVFSYETTPKMEVAKAVRISMSVPLFFEAVISEEENKFGETVDNVFCDGGVMNNYPLNLFDSTEFNSELNSGVNMDTLGVRFTNGLKYNDIDSLIKYIESLLRVSWYIQQQNYESNPLNRERSIIIDKKDVSPLDFNVSANDNTYRFLYYQGYNAARNFFSDGRVSRFYNVR